MAAYNFSYEIHPSTIPALSTQLGSLSQATPCGKYQDNLLYMLNNYMNM